MAGRFLGLFKVFRGKKKEDPGAQQPEEPEQFQPLEDDAATDRTQEQKPARGLFRRTLKMFTKFIRIRHRKTSTTAPEGTAKLNSRLTKFPAEPGVRTNLTVRSEKFNMAVNDHRAKAVVMEMNEGMAITNSHSRMTQGLANTDTTPTPTMIHASTMDFFEESAVSPQHQGKRSSSTVAETRTRHRADCPERCQAAPGSRLRFSVPTTEESQPLPQSQSESRPSRFLGLFKVFRGKKKKDPGAQQPEEPEQFQPLEDDAATDHTQEQKPAHGRFRRTLKMFTKFIRIRHRKTSTTAPEGTAKLNSRLTKFPAEPGIRTNLTARSEKFDMAVNDHRAKAVVMEMNEGMAITNSHSRMTQGLANTDTTPTPTMIHASTMDFFEESAVSPQHQVNSLGPGLETSQDCVSPQATGASQPLKPLQYCGKGSWGSCSFGQCSKTSPCLLQVPAIVRNIHQRLASHVTVDARMQIDIVRLAGEHPADVVLTLLRCAPTCDRAAAMMWRAIGSSVPTVEKVLPTLLCVMEDWPLCHMFTSDGDNKHVFALAATLVLWVIVQVPECHEAMILYSSRLFVALLFHVVITTQHMPPEEVHHFWRGCREQHRLPSNPNRSLSSCPSNVLVASASAPSVTWLCSAHRFAVQAIKSLLCRLQCDNEVIAMERKHGWDTMLCADTQHYAVGLLAREMRHVLIPLCSRIAIHLIRLLSTEKPSWDLPFLAFLVEVLECLDLTKCGGSVLRVISRYLHSKCRQRHRLALRGLVALSQNPLMARRMCCLSQSFVELLDDADGEVVAITLRVFTNMLTTKDILVSSTTAPKLAEALLALFDNDNSYVQLLSIDLFCKVMELVVDKGKKPLKKIVNKSLYPLFIYCHDENLRVANAAWETLHCLTKFLKRRDLEQLLKKEHPSKTDESKLTDDRSRAPEHLRQALPYLQNPQESLREAALRFIGEPRARAPSPARRSSAPAPTPAAAPAAAAAGPGAVEPRPGLGAAAALWQPCPGAAACGKGPG
ncbi:uncharacterized protein [Sylvia atricapilla]|uniref:uncharacterized protein n=1 Tax=Sylvia atricapilla TaxID=48155 RepID=UPI00339082C5